MKKLTLTVGMLCFGAAAYAHHSFAGTYLEDAPPQTIQGKLVQFLLRNPHSFVTVETKDEKGESIRWGVEWGAAGQLAQQGISQGSLRVGDEVIVTGSPGRNPAEHRLRMRAIKRVSDGQVFAGKFD